MNRKANAAAITARREAAGLNQAELAARAGITPAYMSLIETGDRSPSLTIANLARALDCTVDDISGPAEADA